MVKKMSQFTEVTSLGSTSEIIILQNGHNSKISKDNFINSFDINSTSISGETLAREQADIYLNSLITGETSERILADQAINDTITGLSENVLVVTEQSLSEPEQNQVMKNIGLQRYLPIFDVDEDGFYVTDLTGNTGFKLDGNGLDVSKLSTHFQSLLPSSPGVGGSAWASKIVSYLGDSQTAIGAYTAAFGQLTGCINDTYGISGTEITAGSLDSTTAFCVRYTGMTNNSNLVIVFGGINDYLHNRPIGTISDSTILTFYGAMHTLCNGLQIKYGKKPIVFMTPVHYGYELTGNTAIVNSVGSTLKNYVDAIKEVCSIYSIPVVDAYRESGMDPRQNALTSYFYADLLHISTQGGKKLATYMKKIIEPLYNEYYYTI